MASDDSRKKPRKASRRRAKSAPPTVVAEFLCKAPSERGLPGAPLQEIFAVNLRMARIALRLSQRKLGVLAGISHNRISLIENGNDCLLSSLEALAKHVEQSPSDLLTPRSPRR